MSTTSFGNVNGGSRPPSPIGDLDAPATSGSGGASHGGKGHARTQCACGKSGQHFTETALDTVFPSSPEKVYELMFNSDWYKHFLTESQKLRGELCPRSPLSPIHISYPKTLALPSHISRTCANVRRTRSRRMVTFLLQSCVEKPPNKLYKTPQWLHRTKTNQMYHHRRTRAL